MEYFRNIQNNCLYRINGIEVEILKEDDHGGKAWRTSLYSVAEIRHDPVLFRPEPDPNEKPIATADRFPHLCPKCGAPAYLGFNSLDCSSGKGCTR